MLGTTLLFAAMVSGAEPCSPAPPRGMIARSTPFGGVIAHTASDADEAVAAGVLAQEAAKRFLGLRAPPFLIVPASSEKQLTLDNCTFVFPWAFPRSRGGTSRLPAHVLPHEIGHALFIRFLAPRTGNNEYGGGAPDWLDEMAALAFENSAGVRMRRADTRRHAERGALIPLEQLLSMTHPEWSARPIATNSPTELGTRQPTSADTPAFYATVRALLDFLIDRTGEERVIRLMAEEARAGAPIDNWLLANSGRGAALEGLAGLDAEIKAFVLTDPRYNEARENVLSKQLMLQGTGGIEE